MVQGCSNVIMVQEQLCYKCRNGRHTQHSEYCGVQGGVGDLYNNRDSWCSGINPTKCQCTKCT